MAHQFSVSYLEDSIALFHYYKKMTERAMDQVTDEQLFTTLDEEMNSIAIIVKHMVGNMRSRWTEFLTSDGEKPDRKRDTEFEQPPATRQELLTQWSEGWDTMFHALGPLSDSDLERKITIRGEPHSVMQAINRQMAHYAYHCGQIVFLAKHFKASEWKSLTIPRKRSEEFNRRVLKPARDNHWRGK
jgi:uncharacterized damage-inducible protein DinB